MLLSPIHCCDVTKPPYLLSGELCTSPLHSNRLYVYTVCCRRGGQCFSVLRTRHTDVVCDSSGRSYVTEQGHNVPLLHTRGLDPSSVPSGAPCSSFGVAKGKIVVGNVGIFGVFRGVLPFPQISSRQHSIFQSSSSSHFIFSFTYFMSSFTSFMVRKK